jgi:hypothetical protein
MNTWQQKIQEEFDQPHAGANAQRLILELIESTSDRFKEKVQFLSNLGLNMIKDSDSKITLIPRHILSRLYPFDPLRKRPPSPISVAVLTSEKDLEILPYTISGLKYAVTNSIFGLQIVCPEKIRQRVEETLKELTFSQNIEISVLTDEEILSHVNLENFNFVSSVAKMELLKLLIGYASEYPILVLDGDTLLLRARNWISGKDQISPVAQEYFVGHVNFSLRTLDLQEGSGLGYVTHHALFVSEQVRKIIEATGGVERLATEINNGIKKGWGDHGEFPSEWQLYGDSCGMSEAFMKRYPANFSNIGIDRKLLKLQAHPSEKDCLKLLSRIKVAAPALGSISLHDYK